MDPPSQCSHAAGGSEAGRTSSDDDMPELFCGGDDEEEGEEEDGNGSKDEGDMPGLLGEGQEAPGRLERGWIRVEGGAGAVFSTDPRAHRPPACSAPLPARGEEKLAIAAGGGMYTVDFRVALAHAALEGDRKTLEAAVRAGVPVDALLSLPGLPDWMPTALIIASKQGHLSCVDCLLARRADPNLVVQASPKTTALCSAVEAGQVAVIRRLIAGKASVNARVSCGLTPMHMAVLKRSLSCVEVLMAEAPAAGQELDLFLRSDAAEDWHPVAGFSPMDMVIETLWRLRYGGDHKTNNASLEGKSLPSDLPASADFPAFLEMRRLLMPKYVETIGNILSRDLRSLPMLRRAITHALVGDDSFCCDDGSDEESTVGTSGES